MSTTTPIQQAVFEFLKDSGLTLTAAAVAHDLDVCTFSRVLKKWRELNPGVCPSCPSEVRLPERRVGRPRAFSAEDEDLMAKKILTYSEDGWPLTAQLVQMLAEHYLEKFCSDAQKKHFKIPGKPSKGWVEAFIRRRKDICKRCMQLIEDKRVQAMVPSKVGEHIARTIALFKRYRITDPSQVVNLDECGNSFEKMTGKSLRRGVSHAQKQSSVTFTAIRIKGNLNHVTLISVVGADGTAYKPVVVFPGVQPHFRRLGDGRTQTVHYYLPPSYVYQRDPAGVDSKIFLDWARRFLQETEQIRINGRYMAIVMDGFSCHIQPEVLDLFQANRVVCIALPSHSSHRLQPLDVSVFAPYKAALQAEMHRFSRHKRVLDVFGAAEVISVAYGSAVTYRNIVNGFERTGLWVRRVGGPSAEPLTDLFHTGSHKISLKELMASFDKSTRSLMSGAEVVEEGTLRIDTSASPNLSARSVIDALRRREERRAKNKVNQGPSPFQLRSNVRPQRTTRDPQDVDVALKDERDARRDVLNSSRLDRRAIRKHRARMARGARNLVQ